jgi:hypothetical protein
VTIRLLRNRLGRWHAEVIQAHNDAARDGVAGGMREAERRSTGGFSTKMQRLLWGAPFSKARYVRPQLPAGIINAQTGDFYRSWSGYSVSHRGRVQNTSPYAMSLLKGTRYAFARPYDEPIARKMEGFAFKSLSRRLDRANSRMIS